MDYDLEKDKMTVRKVNKISNHVSVQLVALKGEKMDGEREYNNFQEKTDKILITVGDNPIISIPGKIFSSHEQAIQDLLISMEDDEDPKNTEIIDILFQKLVLMLESWIISGYNTRFLFYKIAFPLLKELREIGETKFQIIFQQEILRTYATSSTQVKKFLEEEGYLKLIGEYF